ncbi:PREDICTED: transmembrane protease serine 5 [Cariama cristata]|nr:PREDICTED: transmembrane protease serine 5 [Cariama cristata]
MALVSFRINMANSLLEAQVEGRPGWLLACHERWSLSLGTLLCQQLGYLRMTHQKGVNLTDVKVNDTQEFLQVRPHQEGSLEEMWQVSYRQLQASTWLVFAGIVTRGSIKQEDGVSVKKIIYHPLYNDSSLDYDIALMKLQVPLNFSDAVRAVCLPPSHRDLFQGTPCWVSGWGYTRPDQAQVTKTLKEALVPLIGTKKCNSSCMYAGELTARMLCAGYLQGKTDACQGDSGGPLVCHDEFTWRLVGIVSWGQGCAEPSHPGVYTNVAQLLPWIYHITELKPETEGAPHHLPRLRWADPAGRMAVRFCSDLCAT